MRKVFRAKGFSTIELLWVVLILGILLGITLPRFGGPAQAGLTAETWAQQIAAHLRQAQGLATREFVRYDVEFFDASLGSSFPYRRYRIIERATGTIYKGETFTLDNPRVEVNPLCDGSAQAKTFAFFSDGRSRVYLDSGTTPTKDPNNCGGLTVTGGHVRARIFVKRSTGQVELTICTPQGQIYPAEGACPF